MSTDTPTPPPAYEKALVKLEVNLDPATGAPTSTRLAWRETFRRPDGSVASETYTPDYLDDHNGALSTAALGALADQQARHIETLTATVADHEKTIAEKDADLVTKDANIQQLLTDKADLKAKLDAEIRANGVTPLTA